MQSAWSGMVLLLPPWTFVSRMSFLSVVFSGNFQSWFHCSSWTQEMCWAFPVPCCHQGRLWVFFLVKAQKKKSKHNQWWIKQDNWFFFFLSAQNILITRHLHPLPPYEDKSPLNLMHSCTLTHMQQCTWQCHVAGQTSAGISKLRCGNRPFVAHINISSH